MSSKTKTLLVDELVAELEPEAAFKGTGAARKLKARPLADGSTHDEAQDDLDEKTRHAIDAVLKRSEQKQEQKKRLTVISTPPELPDTPQASASHANTPHASLVQAEHLLLAQERILKLEQEAQRLRDDNEALSTAGQALQKHSGDLEQQIEYKSSKLEKLKNSLANENKMLEQSVQHKNKQIGDLSLKLQQYELRFDKNKKKIRVRERELENRLEIMKLESAALQQAKDKSILNLKQQIDRINDNMDSFQNQQNELNKMIDTKKELINNIERTLKMALSLLNNDKLYE